MRRLKILTAAAAFVLSAGGAHAADVTLTIHHFLSPKSHTHTMLLEPWAERVSQQSGGRIKVEIFPSMSMGGKPAELYRQVRDGFADIVWTLPGYTPGVFPRSEVFELPTVHQGSARATNLAIQKIWPMIKDDFADLHPILVHVHAGNALHLREKNVRTVDDVQGLKIRTPSRTGGWMIEAWGAEPVGMPVPAVPEALSSGVIDATTIPWEVTPALRVAELVHNHTGFSGDRGWYTQTFVFAMNNDSYNNLPDDLKAIIDANCALPACHGGDPTLPDFTVYDNIFARRSLIQSRVVGKSMPPSGSTALSSDNIQKINCWIENGAPQ